MSQFVADPKTAALLVMDFQNAVFDMVATEKEALLARTAKLVDAARKARLRVIYVAGTDLDMILRAGGVDTLVLAGIATSGVVLSTVRHAADADYRLVVVADCCADGDAEVHRVLVEKVFPRQVTVVEAEKVIALLS